MPSELFALRRLVEWFNRCFQLAEDWGSESSVGVDELFFGEETSES